MGIRYSISNSAHSTGGQILINGLNNYKLVPVGSVSNFETRFDNLWTTNIVPYSTIVDVANDIADAEARVDSLLVGYTTTTELSTYVDNNVGASVITTLGSYVSKDGAAAAMYSLEVNADGITSGFELGALSDGPTSTSYFKVMADNFAVYGQADGEVDGSGDPIYSAPLDISGNPIPAFSIQKVGTDYQINFNGQVIFENLQNDSGQTVIDGGRLTTNFIDVGQPVGDFAITKHIGSYVDDAAANLYTGTLNSGDTYHNTTNDVTMYRVSGAWLTTAGANGINGSRGAAHTFLNITTTTPTTGELDTAIYNATNGDTPINGDSVTWTSSNSSANPATAIARYFNVWLANVALYVNGDAIVTGTLSAGDIKAGGTISGNAITGSHGLFDVTYGGVSGGYALGAKGSSAIFIASDLGGTSKLKVFTTYATFDVPVEINGLLTPRQGLTVTGTITGSASSGYAGDFTSATSIGIVGRGNGSTGYGGYFSSTGYYGMKGTTSSNSTAQCGVLGANTAYGKGVIGDAPLGTYGVFTAQNMWAGGAYLSFTGAHHSLTREFSPIIGDIAISTDSALVSVNQSYPKLDYSNINNDKRVVGVYSVDTSKVLSVEALQNPDLSEEIEGDIVIKSEYLQFITDLEADGYRLATINSLGEGGINVCEINGDILNGDYITSSTVSGKGMKQDDDILHSYTVAKSLSDTIWADKITGVDGCYSTLDSDGIEYKTLMIACTYHSG